MKNKKIIAIALCIGLISTSFNGLIPVFAKNNISNGAKIKTNKAELQNITQLEPELHTGELSPALSTSINENMDESVSEDSSNKVNEDKDSNYISEANNEDNSIYEDAGVSSVSDSSDFFSIGKEETETLLAKGYTVEEILEADDIGNEIFEDPIKLLEMKTSTGKSLEEIKKDILKERKDNNTKNIKDKYNKEYNKLIEEGIKEEDAIYLLEYLDINQLQLTDSIIEDYKNKGEDLFKEGINTEDNADEKKNN